MESERLRRLLLAVFVLGILGTTAELVLLEHFETWRQWLPLAVLGLGLLAAGVLAMRATRRTVLALRASGALLLLAGALGVYFHLESNVAFELEMDDTIAGRDLAWESLTGALPALAPGSMVLLGLIALVVAAGHPALDGGLDR